MNLQLDLIIWMLANIIILFVLAKKFLVKDVVKSLATREELIKKLESADQQYDEMMAKAKDESDKVIKQGLDKKDAIIKEAELLADKKTEKMMSSAEIEAAKITEKAQDDAKLLSKELESNFEAGVKQTTQTVVNKLLGENKDIQKSYLDTLIKEATKN